MARLWVSTSGPVLFFAAVLLAGHSNAFQCSLKLAQSLQCRSRTAVDHAVVLGHAMASFAPSRRNGACPLRMSAVMESETSSKSSAAPVNNIKYATLEETNLIDEDLADEGGISLTTLTELGGKGLADAISAYFPPERIDSDKILIICGKGPSGGHGLVAARYLTNYGYEVEVVFPERQPKEPFTGLVKQLKNMDIRVNMGMPGTANRIGLIVDAIYGLTYEPPVKAPWELILKQLNNPDYFAGIPVLSVDVPAGWNVDKGAPKDGSPYIEPDVLVSLGHPKRCSARFDGPHYLAGRYISKRMQFKHKLNLPAYEGINAFTVMPPPPPMPEEEEESPAAAPPAESAPAQTPAAPAPVVNPLLGLNALVSNAPADSPTVPAAAAVAAAASPSPAAAAAAAVRLQTMPGAFEADPQVREALDRTVDQVLEIVQTQGEGWTTEVRKVVSPRLVPLGWSSNYPPDRTTVAKVCFVVAKALKDAGADNLDVLSEGRAIAESAFEDSGELGAGKILRGIAYLYGRNGNTDAQELILEGVERIVAERGLNPDLEAPPSKPLYGYGDKWTISLKGPASMGGDVVDVVVRPTQQSRLLLKAWLQSKGMGEADMGRFELSVVKSKLVWRDGPVALDDPVGETGLVNLAQVEILERAGVGSA